ncbi:VOC family protein [Auraticoccus sp. F435]|uniref:VOC family protein n=1 Tax=Auraticoccus cholistanensis TaxID=2656650 RepID=A0A6A9UWP5_9ACTN|nr:VOC family protein [Auraticoccus cholistanensis]MVA76085.1 VOC family protein [Auraticoccus cholistanensis]
MTGDVGDLHVGTVVVNVNDMDRAVAFWRSALGYRLRESEVDPEFTMLVSSDPARPPISLQLTDQPVLQPVRLHLDLYTSEQERQVERLVALGASRVEDWQYPEDPDFVVLRDPDGNEFCVIAHQPVPVRTPAPEEEDGDEE